MTAWNKLPYKGWMLSHAGTRKRGTMWKAYKQEKVLEAGTKMQLIALIDAEESK